MRDCGLQLAAPIAAWERKRNQETDQRSSGLRSAEAPSAIPVSALYSGRKLQQEPDMH